VSTAKRIRPTGENGAETKVLSAGSNGFILPELADISSAQDSVDGVFVAVVELANGNHRRHCYFSLSSAERAVRRANERGQRASIVLCQLAPVGVVA
jgi:predicted enzyme related to lactoylglutathione lyase